MCQLPSVVCVAWHLLKWEEKAVVGPIIKAGKGIAILSGAI